MMMIGAIVVIMFYLCSTKEGITNVSHSTKGTHATLTVVKPAPFNDYLLPRAVYTYLLGYYLTTKYNAAGVSPQVTSHLLLTKTKADSAKDSRFKQWFDNDLQNDSKAYAKEVNTPSLKIV